MTIFEDLGSWAKFTSKLCSHCGFRELSMTGVSNAGSPSMSTTTNGLEDLRR
jgi:hypothetical protein